MPFPMLGYELVHHGEGRWNGVAIRAGSASTDVITNFGDGPVRDSGRGRRAGSTRRTSTRSTRRAWSRPCAAACGSSSLYAPNGRVVDSPFYEGKLRWFERRRALARRDRGRRRAARARRRLQRDARARGRVGRGQGARRHARLAAGACGARRRSATGAWSTPTDPSGPSPAASRGGTTAAGMFHRNEGMRIDLLYATTPVADAGRLGRDRPRGAQGPADAVGPRAGRHRPRRARQAVRRRLGGGPPADLGADEAPALTRPARAPRESPRSGILRGPRPSPEVPCPN